MDKMFESFEGAMLATTGFVLTLVFLVAFAFFFYSIAKKAWSKLEGSRHLTTGVDLLVAAVIGIFPFAALKFFIPWQGFFGVITVGALLGFTISAVYAVSNYRKAKHNLAKEALTLIDYLAISVLLEYTGAWITSLLILLHYI